MKAKRKEKRLSPRADAKRNNKTHQENLTERKHMYSYLPIPVHVSEADTRQGQ
jgi:hypothetical protein